MGKVFDIYFNFGTARDSYLGRVLAGLDPNSDEFGILPLISRIQMKLWKKG